MTEKCGEVVIRDAVLTDAERIREIYDHYVRHTAISFEYETPMHIFPTDSYANANLSCFL